MLIQDTFEIETAETVIGQIEQPIFGANKQFIASDVSCVTCYTGGCE